MERSFIVGEKEVAEIVSTNLEEVHGGEETGVAVSRAGQLGGVEHSGLSGHYKAPD